MTDLSLHVREGHIVTLTKSKIMLPTFSQRVFPLFAFKCGSISSGSSQTWHGRTSQGYDVAGEGSNEDTHHAVGRSGPRVTALSAFLSPSSKRREIFKRVFILVFLVVFTFIFKLWITLFQDFQNHTESNSQRVDLKHQYDNQKTALL